MREFLRTLNGIVELEYKTGRTTRRLGDAKPPFYPFDVGRQTIKDLGLDILLVLPLRFAVARKLAWLFSSCCSLQAKILAFELTDPDVVMAMGSCRSLLQAAVCENGLDWSIGYSHVDQPLRHVYTVQNRQWRLTRQGRQGEQGHNRLFRSLAVFVHCDVLPRQDSLTVR